MSAHYLLGLDIGTSLIKSVIFDLNGNEIGKATTSVPIDSPQPTWFEQDMNAVWRGTAQTIREAINHAAIDPKDIAVVGPAGQGDGLWCIDKEGNPLRPAPLWNDGRAEKINNDWEKDGTLSTLFPKVGTTLWPGAQGGLLKWLKVHDPASYAEIGTTFFCKDWIKFKLTGTLSTDETDGSIPFMNLAERRFDVDQMKLLGLEDVAGKLPQIVPSNQIVGTITPEAAAATRLVPGTPVISGLLDVVANAIGIGVVEKGQTFTLLGTTALNAVVLDQPQFAPADIGASICHGLPGLWMRVLAAMSGTPNLDWFLENVVSTGLGKLDQNEGDIYHYLEESIKDIPVGSGGVIFHPYLQGERAPFLNSDARAGFFGISNHTTQQHLTKAVYEGVAYSIRNCFERSGSEVRQVMLAGGGANSPAWCQIMADVTNCTMVVPAVSEFGTLGVALLGGVTVGLFNSLDEAIQQCVRVERIYEPNRENVSQYDTLYQLYIQLIDAMIPFWAARQEFLAGTNNN